MPDSSAGIRPCDGINKGNHYCCDPGPAIGSFACCDNTTDIFVLGTSIPTVLAQMPLSQLSTSTTASSTAANTATSPSSSNSAGTGNGSGSSTNTTAIGLGVGLGVGIPVAAIIAGAFWFFGRRGRKGSTAYDTTPYGGSPASDMATTGVGYPHEPGYQQMPKYGGPPVDGVQEGYQYNAPPTELSAHQTPQELPAATPH